jgi:hypothetical protein
MAQGHISLSITLNTLALLGSFSSEGPQNIKIIVVLWSIFMCYRYTYHKHLRTNSIIKERRMKLDKVEAGFQ